MVEITVLCVTCLACEASCSPTWLFRVNWMVSITFLYGNRPCPFTDATPKWMLITIIPLKEILRNSMLYPRLLGPSYLSILNSISKFFPNFFKRISFPNFQNYPSIVKILLNERIIIFNKFAKRENNSTWFFIRLKRFLLLFYRSSCTDNFIQKERKKERRDENFPEEIHVTSSWHIGEQLYPNHENYFTSFLDGTEEFFGFPFSEGWRGRGWWYD